MPHFHSIYFYIHSMAKDFTLDIYGEMLKAAIAAGYHLTSFEAYLNKPGAHGKTFILRHDVDKLPDNSLRTAQLQASLGAKGTYYFRVVKGSFHPRVIESIRDLGHEIGYHYEDMDICKGDTEKALLHFEKWLARFREFYPVKTICMHGSPMSKWDNRLLWKENDYKKYDIIAEPYYDLDFKKVFYLTDTGRKWDGEKVSIRDKVDSGFDLSFHHTQEIIDAFNQGRMPDTIMHNIHPQRWTNSPVLWTKELLLQNLKNQIKGQMVRMKR